MTPDAVRDRRLPAQHDPRDPRDRVTPDDLNVAPELLGAPLARPMQRLLAIGIDITILAALSNFGNFWLIAGLALLALVHLRDPLAGRAPSRKWLLWTVAAGLLAFGAQQAWVAGRLVHEDRSDASEAAEDAIEAAAEALTSASAPAGVSTKGLVIEGVASAVPVPTPLQAAEARVAVLQAQLAEARKPKSFNLGERVMGWADEVGLGLGWAILYFALLPVCWNGQTIGKRLLGLRVVELTGKPMTAMRAFKRYGGYAAGLATGMFGFAQVLWDPNRQAIQDKTAHTVVIDLRRKLADPLEPPPSEEPR
ncbi:MAG: RDD family protein [Burkholderiales bacterium]